MMIFPTEHYKLVRYFNYYKLPVQAQLHNVYKLPVQAQLHNVYKLPVQAQLHNVVDIVLHIYSMCKVETSCLMLTEYM